MRLKFGDVLVNGYASIGNPIRTGIFVRRTAKHLLLTDGKGQFWEMANHDKITKLGSVIGQDLKDLKEREEAAN